MPSFTVLPQPLSPTLAVLPLFSSPSIISFSRPTPCPKSNYKTPQRVPAELDCQTTSAVIRFRVLKEGSKLHREPWLHVRHSRRHGRLTAKMQKLSELRNPKLTTPRWFFGPSFFPCPVAVQCVWSVLFEFGVGE